MNTPAKTSRGAGFPSRGGASCAGQRRTRGPAKRSPAQDEAFRALLARVLAQETSISPQG
jgi:hypothetical protein